MPPDSSGDHLTVCGLGNIGSHLVDHLGLMPRLAKVTLIDMDHYEPGNRAGQSFHASDLGRPKAVAQARRLRRLNPALKVDALHDDLRALPLGRMRSGLIVGCLDNPESRLALNAAAWRLGIPWLDAGVEPGSMLVRITGYQPAPDQPCFECALEEADYRERLPARFPCHPVPAPHAATQGSPHTGRLVAALLALEIRKVLEPIDGMPVFGRQILLDAAHHRHFVSTLPRRESCRFDHQTWNLVPGPLLSPRLSLRRALDRIRRAHGLSPEATLRLENLPFAARLHCPRCSHRLDRFHLLGRLGLADHACSDGARRDLLASGFELVDRVGPESDPAVLALSLARVGVQLGDVLTVADADQTVRVEMKGIPHE